MKLNLKTKLELEVCWTSEVEADEAAARVGRDGGSGAAPNQGGLCTSWADTRKGIVRT